MKHKVSSKTLSNLFNDAGGMRIVFTTTFKFYLGQIAEVYETETHYDQYDDSIVPTLSEKFEDDIHLMGMFHHTWKDNVVTCLSLYPEEYAKIFDVEPQDYRGKFSKGLPMIEERMEFLSTCNEDFREYVNECIEEYDEFCAQVDALEKILEKDREDKYRRFCAAETIEITSRGSTEQKDVGDDVAYELHFEEFQSELYVNEYKIRRCNVKSDFGDAIMQALNSPEKSAKVPENMAQNVSALKIPPELRRMMFRVGSGQMKVSPIITYAQIKNAGLDVKILNNQFKKMLGKIS